MVSLFYFQQQLVPPVHLLCADILYRLLFIFEKPERGQAEAENHAALF